jgi:hypothetical protein
MDGNRSQRPVEGSGKGRGRGRRIPQAIREFLYGLTGLEFERQALELRGSLETIFFVTTLGDMLGVPVMPPIYSLRLLPYAMPHIATWKRRMLREREFSDSEEFHLHGV